MQQKSFKSFFSILVICLMMLGLTPHVKAQEPTQSQPQVQGEPQVSVQIKADSAAADDDGDDFDIKGPGGHLKFGRHRGPNDIWVPIAFFIFLLGAILGSRYIRSRNEQARLELLRTMVEKGQPVPESVVKEILGGGHHGSWHRRHHHHHGARGYKFAFIGAGLLAYTFFSHGSHSGIMIAGIVLFALGLGSIVGQKMSPPSVENNVTNKPE